MQSKAIAIENDLRATLRNFGLKVGVVGTVKFEARIKELVENLPDLPSTFERRRQNLLLMETLTD
jgi:transposase